MAARSNRHGATSPTNCSFQFHRQESPGNRYLHDNHLLPPCNSLLNHDHCNILSRHDMDAYRNCQLHKQEGFDNHHPFHMVFLRRPLVACCQGYFYYKGAVYNFFLILHCSLTDEGSTTFIFKFIFLILHCSWTDEGSTTFILKFMQSSI